MPRNTLTGGKTTLFRTAEQGTIRSGTGTTLEVTSRSDTRIATISCYAEVIPELNLPSEVVDSSDYFEGTIGKDNKTGKKSSPRADVMSVVHRGNGYVTVYLPQKVMSRYELRDLLQGLGWRLAGLTTCSHEGAMVREEVWSSSTKRQRTTST